MTVFKGSRPHRGQNMAGILATVGLVAPGILQIAFRGVETVVLAPARPGGRLIRESDLSLPDLEAADLSADFHMLLHEQFDILGHAGGGTAGRLLSPEPWGTRNQALVGGWGRAQRSRGYRLPAARAPGSIGAARRPSSGCARSRP